MEVSKVMEELQTFKLTSLYAFCWERRGCRCSSGGAVGGRISVQEVQILIGLTRPASHIAVPTISRTPAGKGGSAASA